VRRVLALFLFVLAAGCGGDPSAMETTRPAGEPVEVAGRTLAGEELSLAEFRGTPVFVNVWASW
jgi:hypothetical protein